MLTAVVVCWRSQRMRLEKSCNFTASQTVEHIEIFDTNINCQYSTWLCNEMLSSSHCIHSLEKKWSWKEIWLDFICRLLMSNDSTTCRFKDSIDEDFHFHVYWTYLYALQVRYVQHGIYTAQHGLNRAIHTKRDVSYKLKRYFIFYKSLAIWIKLSYAHIMQ